VIQLLTASEILEGRDADIPRWGMETFQKAARSKTPGPKQEKMGI